jgi:hypothetical protein
MKINQLKNSQLLQELSQRIKDKRIRFTQKTEQCIGGLLSWDDFDKYWLDLSELDEVSRNLTTHWHSQKVKPLEKQEKAILDCQECQSPIKMSRPDEKGRKVLEFFGKWTSQGYKIVCQNCLEKK